MIPTVPEDWVTPTRDEVEKARRIIYGRWSDDEAARCRSEGWRVGTVLIGDEGYGPTIIRITAIGQRRLLAQRFHTATGQWEGESSWTLTCRDWKFLYDTDLASA